METEILIRNHQRLIRPDRRRIVRFLRKAIGLAWPRAVRSFHLPSSPPSVEISVLFVNDRRMRYLNRAHRGIDRTTDVLSFPQLAVDTPGWSLTGPQGIPVPLGDIIVNLHQAEREALSRGADLHDEVLHLLLHGLLHLLGYDHEGDPRQARMMKRLHKDIEREAVLAAGGDR